MWDEICSISDQMTAMKPTTLALSYLRTGLAAEKKASPHKPSLTERKTTKKTLKKDYDLYLYNGEGPDGFYYESDREVIETLKAFFYKISERAKMLFDKCMVDPAKKPEGEALEVLADYTSQLWELKQEKWDE